MSAGFAEPVGGGDKGYKLGDRHHGKTGLRDVRKDDVANETNEG